MWLLDYMCKVNASQNINHTIEYDFVCKTREHGLFRQKNIRTCFFRQENMRTRGRVKAWLSKKRTWGLVGLCPTLDACVSSLKPLDFSLFTFHFSLLNIKTREHENKREGWRLDWAKREHEVGLGLPNTRCLRYPHLNHWIFHSSLFTFHF